MLDVGAFCPHCEEKFKMNWIGLEAKELIQSPHCRRMIKRELADSGKKAIRIGADFVG
jgi:Zn ribbon nucleic-acid-binding protein